MRRCLAWLWLALGLLAFGQPPVVHSVVGERASSADGGVVLTNLGKKQQYDWRDAATLDRDVFSPKSVNFRPDGVKYYVNSLEGCATVVYRTSDNAKLKVISHRFASGQGPLWAAPSGLYRFTHYDDGERRAFGGKPVEGAFTHGGRYLWVPYYRRTFDLNAQDPSAIAVIDTEADSIVRMMETGPLPKMVAVSHDGRTLAVTHWGNNTVGLIDVSGDDPRGWHHVARVVVERELELNFSLTVEVNRDANSGLLLRGTVFTPDDRHLLVGCMGGGGIAVVDLASRRYVGKIGGIANARHLLVDHGYLYASVNAAGLVQRARLDSVMAAVARLEDGSARLAEVPGGWTVCRVGGGARTIEVSPSGRWLFAACNSASALYVVDTRTMTVATHIAVDSYPVGLDISRDGRHLVVTSQARNYHGGNAVNLFGVEYGDWAAEEAALAELSAAADSTRNDQATADGEATDGSRGWLGLKAEHWPVVALVVIVAVMVVLYRMMNRKDNDGK